MKLKQKFFYICLSLLISFCCTEKSFSQIYNPVKWEFSVKKISDTQSALVTKATIGKGWHLYSQFMQGKDGPIPTTFSYSPSANYVLAGKTEESKAISKYEPLYEMNLNYFEDNATFTQKISVKSEKDFTLTGKLNFMVCNDSMCLPPKDVDFSFNISASKTKTAIIPTEKINQTTTVDSNALKSSQLTLPAKTDSNKQTVVVSAPTITNSIEDASTAQSTGLSGWMIFFLGFLGGLAALVTPCVFPMIPLTVSFFTKQSSDPKKGLRKAIFYGLSIIFIYVLLGVIITLAFGSSGLNAISTNEWMNLFFFIIFVIFGISFLGAFEITLPSSWANKADQASEKGGIIGIFFMAFTLSLVSFSCTGPIIGSLLANAATGGHYINLIIGMFGFSLALALPFTLFAAFPGWMNSLPKSGGWLNNVKVVLGLLEIAFSLKFLSAVDLAGLHCDWLHIHLNGPLGIMGREIFISLWIVIFIILGFYLLGKIKFSHDSDVKYVSIPKLFLAIFSFAFAVYLVPGLWGAPLKLISGFVPPYSEGWQQNVSSNVTNSNVVNSIPPNNDGIECPNNISCFHDYDKALAYAKQMNKPLLIDFTGINCVNCRKMEKNVWSDPEVLKRLNQDFVVAMLYVDEKNELPQNAQYISKTTGQNIETIGDKWSDLETSKYNTNAEPWDVLVDANGNTLNTPRGYNPDIQIYIQFLDQGKAEFLKRSKK
ncbi:MAG: cytochrome c biogenesis protein CcdA [Bacteroidia bacterium]